MSTLPGELLIGEFCAALPQNELKQKLTVFRTLVNINGNIGTIQNYRNAVFTDCAFFGYGLVFDGSFNTVAFNNSLFVASGAATTVLTLAATAIITRRFRIIYSSFSVGTGLTGINVSVSASIPAENYILDNVNFSGAGTYLAGVSYTTNTALFRECVGIQNTTVKGIMYMNANAIATVIPNTDDYVKVAGTTTLYEAEKYTMPEDNQLTNGATIQRNYVVYVTLSFSSTAGNVCEFGIFDSAVGDIVLPARVKSTANAAGRAENISLVTNIQHSTGDYVEVWCRNTSAANNITVDVLNMVINSQ